MKALVNVLLKMLFCFVILTVWGCGTTQADISKKRGAYSEAGLASFYSDKHQNRKTANGEIYKHNLKTAAHKTLLFGSKVKVTNISNGKSVVVKINDRGPFVKGRIIDLSKSAFGEISKHSAGVVKVKIELIE